MQSWALHIAVCLLLVVGAGIIPAVDTGTDVPAAAEAGDLAAARAIIAAMSKPPEPSAAALVDLDAALSPAQRAELLAFTALITAKLDVATNYTTWVEKRGYREFRKVCKACCNKDAACVVFCLTFGGHCCFSTGQLQKPARVLGQGLQ
jgi:hypothetical protein